MTLLEHVHDTSLAARPGSLASWEVPPVHTSLPVATSPSRVMTSSHNPQHPRPHDVTNDQYVNNNNTNSSTTKRGSSKQNTRGGAGSGSRGGSSNDRGGSGGRGSQVSNNSNNPNNPNTPGAPVEYASQDGFRKFRILQTGSCRGGNYHLNCSGIELYGHLYHVPKTDSKEE